MSATHYFIQSDWTATPHLTLRAAHYRAAKGDVIIEVFNDGSVMGDRTYYYVNSATNLEVLDVH